MISSGQKIWFMCLYNRILVYHCIIRIKLTRFVRLAWNGDNWNFVSSFGHNLLKRRKLRSDRNSINHFDSFRIESHQNETNRDRVA